MTRETTQNAKSMDEMTEKGRAAVAPAPEMPNDASDSGSLAPSLASLPTEILCQIVETFDESSESATKYRNRFLRTSKAVYLAACRFSGVACTSLFGAAHLKCSKKSSVDRPESTKARMSSTCL